MFISIVPGNIHTSPLEELGFSRGEKGGGGGSICLIFKLGGGGGVTKGMNFQRGYRILKPETEIQRFKNLSARGRDLESNKKLSLDKLEPVGFV